MTKHVRAFARAVAAVALAAAPMAMAPAVASADTGAHLRIAIGTSPEASVTPNLGTVELASTVRGVLAGEAVDLSGCTATAQPATLATGAGTVTIAGCTGSEATFALDQDSGGSSAGLSIKSYHGWVAYWCDIYEVNGARVYDCYLRYHEN